MPKSPAKCEQSRFTGFGHMTTQILGFSTILRSTGHAHCRSRDLGHAYRFSICASWVLVVASF